MAWLVHTYLPGLVLFLRPVNQDYPTLMSGLVTFFCLFTNNFVNCVLYWLAEWKKKKEAVG